MKSRDYLIQYSIIVNGEEFPRSIEIHAKDADDAKTKFNNIISKASMTSEVIIKEISPC